MEFRRLLLRIMLWSLGIGAFLGATTILAGGGTVVWRVSTTTICAAVAAALMMAGSRLSEQKGGWPAGILLMGLVIIEFLGSLVLTWGEHFLLYNSVPGNIGWTMFCLFLCGLAAIVLLWVGSAPVAKLATPVGLVTTCAAFTLLMVCIWGPSNWQAYEDWFDSGVFVGLIGLLLAGTMIGAVSNVPFHLRAIRFIGALAATVAMVVALVGIWTHSHSDTGAFRIPLSLACVVTLAQIALLVPLKPGQNWVRWLTIVTGVTTAVFINMSMTFSKDAEMLGRLGGASGIVAACGMLALVIFARLNQRMGEPPTVLNAVTQVTLVCPSCQTKQIIAVGGAACSSCRLLIHVRVEEPRCPLCDYLLYLCKSDRCPECGTLIAVANTATSSG